ncbi:MULTISPECIES: large conductance mechanosensitive channel protein MscL [Ureibacillus]|uniref:Large-conductance mechanosensitive channel n=1 Tax=Ureibacillus thermosphaericus TaxID=51173 RepID=A0A840Q051_URETH|nr:large conductance mechanosensitive channel protein MscL [Ureibacillus thermosphaericus]MBB5148446.1 large conductance mechanosensitive channel [Ureibacillus thermosphaericus]NKZ31222.1 large conductance mechanosensitive channel protein MscL [Ureibacillus thermosphaericus]
MWKEFKEFAMKGNVIDLAIAVVIGAAFGQIVSSLVDNIIMPLVGILTGGIDFTKSFIWQVGDATVSFGIFLQSVIDFLIISFAIFMFIRIINKIAKKKKEEAVEESAPELDTKEELLKEIRDLLKAQNTNN